nr:MAG TPA: hypothetical protein [Caudoviricetes sp.]
MQSVISFSLTYCTTTGSTHGFKPKGILSIIKFSPAYCFTPLITATDIPMRK